MNGGLNLFSRHIGVVQTSTGIVRTVRIPEVRTTCENHHNVNLKKSVTRRTVERSGAAIIPRDVNKRNLFVNLSVFFSEHDDSEIIVEQLLEDQLHRGIITMNKLVLDLAEYCSQFCDAPNNSCRLFIRSSFAAITWCSSYCDVTRRTRDVIGRINYLLQHHANSLTMFLGLISKPEFSSFALFIDAFQDVFKSSTSVPMLRSQHVLKHLGAFLDACTKLKVCHCHGVHFIDMTLGFGETPLIAAIRARQADTVALLLRYGAQTETSWLSYQNCLEVLLFTPNMTYIDDEQMCNIHACLENILKNTKRIDMKRLKELSKDYYAVMDTWQDVLQTYACVNGPPSLKHSCRIRIREVLKDNWSLPNGVHDLPLPKPIKRYLDLTSS